MISGIDELLDYTKGFLDEDTLRYVKEVVNNDADDIARLKKIAQLIRMDARRLGRNFRGRS